MKSLKGDYQYRVVQAVGHNTSRKIRGVGNKDYTLCVTVPSPLAKTLQLRAGSILRFSIQSGSKLVAERVDEE
jgi:antitoxin component of MazEF toxin-antitoxin module